VKPRLLVNNHSLRRCLVHSALILHESCLTNGEHILEHAKLWFSSKASRETILLFS
jgi:hypothetical protein